MKIDCKQTRTRSLFFQKSVLSLLVGILTVLFTSSSCFAPTRLSDKELSDIDSQAIFAIEYYTGTGTAIPFGTSYAYNTGSQTVLRLRLGLDLEMNAFMRSFKFGYYTYPRTGDWNTTGWDQDVSPYYFGTRDRTTPLVWRDLYIDFGFDNFTSAASKTLNYIEVGTPSATGQVTGSLIEVNALQLTGTGTNSGVMIRGTAGGSRQISFSGGNMAFIFATKYRYVSRQHTGSPTSNLSGIFVKIPDYNTNQVTRP